MVSDFRKKKLTYLFKIFFDSDGSGSVTKEEFEQMIGKIAKAKGWADGDEAYKQAKKVMGDIWEGIQQKADINKDGEVSLDEWINLWDDFANNSGEPQPWQAHYCKAIFFIQDSTGDGVIDKNEFSNVHASFGMSKEDAEKAFDKAANGKSGISWDDFQKLWLEYFTSEDENAPGNYIFGNLKF
ncbi:calexcitin-2-like [Danaus plexippus]|uniref:Juvenile hormone diol kinase n=1 Tax=Danaus plexippus plexippus TaxID=278856 RepID=A0A212F2E2_DANPL|nr:calexcitin-2-like [Danaus plexippus]OWR47915.1 juvenile hormone diol kinase [Danaus plexippus plexippus]